MIDKKNQLQSKWDKYEARKLKRLCNQIPEERRQQLSDEIKVRAALMGFSNGTALKITLKNLNTQINAIPGKSLDNQAYP